MFMTDLVNLGFNLIKTYTIKLLNLLIVTMPWYIHSVDSLIVGLTEHIGISPEKMAEGIVSGSSSLS